MPEYLSPGVYVEEVDTGAKPIEGVSTSTVGMVGVTQRGPTTGLPVLVTSFADFKRKFGSYLDDSLSDAHFLAYAVEGFFQNGGQRVYIKRVPGKGSTFAEASKTAKGGMVTTLATDTIFDTASVPGGTKDRTKKVKLSSLRGVEAGTTLKFTQIYEGVKTAETATVASYDSGKKEVTLSAVLPAVLLQKRYQQKYTAVTVDVGIATPDDTILFEAKDEGSWGNSVKIQVKHVNKGKTTVAVKPTVLTKIELNSSTNFYKGAVIEIDNGLSKLYRTITTITGRVITIDTALANASDAPIDARIVTCEFSLLASYGTEQEVFDFMTMNSSLDSYYTKVLEKSNLIKATPPVPASTDAVPFNQPCAEDGLTIKLEGGGDGTKPDYDDFIGEDNGPGARSGIQAMVDIDQVSLVAVPGITDKSVLNALIIHCETLKDRFAVLDTPKDQDIADVQDFRSDYDTKYAAMYYPWISIDDSLTDEEIDIPPSGHVLGIYARTDIERGVHKAPANEVLRGITGLELTINKAEQDILNPPPNQINVLRDFRRSGRGYRVWGARCITSDPDWKYINVRRLFIFIEESIEEGTQWVVFEPNDEPTWARVRRSVSNFLHNIWRDGALQGTKAEEAFFVKCDRTTMTQTDIDNGKLIMLIGIAPVKPAEFVIFRIGQWTGGSEIEE